MLGFNGGRIGIANTVFTGTKSDDPNYSSVSLLLNGNDLTDSSSYNHTVTANGDAQISTAQSKFGGASMYFDGSGDYLTLPASAGFLFPGDHTIECWIHWDGTYFDTGRNIYGTGNAGSLDQFGIFAGVGLYWGGVYNNVSSNYPPINQWAHVAASRQGSTIRLFINGVLTASGTQSASIGSSTGSAYVGNRADLFHPFKGYIDDLRITKGVARYTSNFDPPTAQLPGGETGTFASGVWTLSDHIKQIRNELWPGLVPPIVTDGLVVHLDAGYSASYPGSGTTWTDLSGNGNDATLIGTPSYTVSPGYFDITSDSTYVRLSSYSHLTNDFTYSMWVRFDAFDGGDTLIENGSWTDTLLFRVESRTSITVFAEGALRGTFTWNPSINTWYNVVFTRSGSTNTLYVNGTQSGLTFTDQTNISLSNAYTFLMRSQHTTNQFTNGQLAQYAMYNKALTPSEITQNFDALKGIYGL